MTIKNEARVRKKGVDYVITFFSPLCQLKKKRIQQVFLYNFYDEANRLFSTQIFIFPWLLLWATYIDEPFFIIIHVRVWSVLKTVVFLISIDSSFEEWKRKREVELAKMKKWKKVNKIRRIRWVCWAQQIKYGN